MSYNQSGNILITTGGCSAVTTAGGTSTVIPTSFTASGTYSISTIGYGGGGGTGMLSVASTGYGWKSKGPEVKDDDLVIKRPNGVEIKVGSAIEQICESLMIILEPDTKLLEDNPSLKEAYIHHQTMIRDIFDSKAVRESYESYKTMRKLVSQNGDEK